MKPKYSIGLIIFIISIVYIVSASIPDKTEQSNELSISTDGEVLAKDYFYLHDSNGYIIVYAEDNKTIYEYTNIQTESLPEVIQQEIKNGKLIKSKEELYGFLENYSS